MKLTITGDFEDISTVVNVLAQLNLKSVRAEADTKLKSARPKEETANKLRSELGIEAMELYKGYTATELHKLLNRPQNESVKTLGFKLTKLAEHGDLFKTRTRISRVYKRIL